MLLGFTLTKEKIMFPQPTLTLTRRTCIAAQSVSHLRQNLQRIHAYQIRVRENARYDVTVRPAVGDFPDNPKLFLAFRGAQG